MDTVILSWVFLQGVGWALIYYPHMPGGFVYSSGVDPAEYPGFIEALCVSFVTLATLGYGDAVPVEPWIRLVSPFQALIGIALLTVAVTWFTQLYPPLSRRRALALESGRLADTSYAEAPAGLIVAPTDRAITSQEVAVRVRAQQLSPALEQLGAELRTDFRLTGDTQGRSSPPTRATTPLARSCEAPKACVISG